MRESGQIRYIARFLASSDNGSTFPWNPFDLRGFDVDIGDDMLACLAALRWAKAELYRPVPDGEKRVEAVIELWALQWPASDWVWMSFLRVFIARRWVNHVRRRPVLQPRCLIAKLTTQLISVG